MKKSKPPIRYAEDGRELFITKQDITHTRRWMEAELALLRRLVDAGEDARSIRKNLQRPIMGVKAKAKQLGLSMRSARHGGPQK